MMMLNLGNVSLLVQYSIVALFSHIFMICFVFYPSFDIICTLFSIYKKLFLQ